MGERTSRVLVIVAAAGALAGGWAAATWLTQPGRGDRSSLRAGSDAAPIATLAEGPEPPPNFSRPTQAA